MLLTQSSAVKPILHKKNILHGAFIYSVGDTIAALIINDFSIGRLIGILFLGGIVYAFEIPAYLKWLNKKFGNGNFLSKGLAAVLFTLYFNPLWIARHLLILNLFAGDFAAISWELLQIGWESFIWSFFFTLPVNYIITNVLPSKWKFIVTAAFSSCMAIYYALSEVLFK